MKKKFLFSIIVFFILICTCNAKSCTIISGSGLNIGDEIDCSGERFYIIKNEEDSVKALAKYNLNVGDNLESTNHIEYPGSFYTEDGIQFMINTCKNNYGENFTYRRSSYSPEKSRFICTYRYTPNNEIVKQDELYVGMAKTYVEGELTKDYGIVTFNQYQFISNNNSYLDVFYDANIIGNNIIDNYLNSYKNYLASSDINIQDIDILAISDIVNIFEKDNLSNEQIKNAFTNNNYWVHYIRFDDAHDAIGDIRLLSNKYSWLYNTTYWTRTVSNNAMYLGDTEINNNKAYIDELPNTTEIYFVNYNGKICHTPYSTTFLGVGIRPVITISKATINYLIETKTNGNGYVTAEKIEAPEGALIKFTVEPKQGYVLGEVKVIDSEGNIIIFKDYSFTMPSSNVTIEATFVKAESEVINPKTSRYISISLIILSIALFILLLALNRQKKRLE